MFYIFLFFLSIVLSYFIYSIIVDAITYRKVKKHNTFILLKRILRWHREKPYREYKEKCIKMMDVEILVDPDRKYITKFLNKHGISNDEIYRKTGFNI